MKTKKHLYFKGFASLLLVVLFVITGCKKKDISDEIVNPVDNLTPLCFTAGGDGAKIYMDVHGELSTIPKFEYSYDRKTWYAYIPDTTVVTLENYGDKVYFRGDNPNGLSLNTVSYVSFRIKNIAVEASGNVMSLIDTTCRLKTIPSKYCFSRLFAGTRITTAPDLPATTLTDYCYYCMFGGCELLGNAPKLPAKTLAPYCYYHMFAGSGVHSVPELPATHLAEHCYDYMFSSCRSINVAPSLPATKLAPYCYSSMFDWCLNLMIAPKLPATTLEEGCYMNMFGTCVNLSKAPDLPATNLADYCYQYMFSACISLAKAPELPATKLAIGCYRNMFNDCTALTQAPELPATVLAKHCYAGMFKTCAQLTKAPELPATELVYCCYYEMFYECFQLKSIKVHFTKWLDSDSTTCRWVYDLLHKGTFYCPASLPQEFGLSRIPEGWTVETF